MDRATEWLLDGVATFVLWYFLDLLKGYLQSVGSLPFRLTFIPQLDIFSLAILAVAALLAFGRFYSPGEDTKRLGQTSEDLKAQFPGVSLFLNPWLEHPEWPWDGYRTFRNRSEYLRMATALLQKADLESGVIADFRTRDSRVTRATRNDILRLATPLLKARRRYRLSLGEKVSDLLGFFP